MCAHGIRDQGGIDWEPPDLQHLVHTFRLAKGSGGVDRWHASELRHSLLTLSIGSVSSCCLLKLRGSALGSFPNVAWWFCPSLTKFPKVVLPLLKRVLSASSLVSTELGLLLGLGRPA